MVRGFGWKKSCTTWHVPTLNTGVKGDDAYLLLLWDRVVEVVQDFFHQPSQDGYFWWDVLREMQNLIFAAAAFCAHVFARVYQPSQERSFGGMSWARCT